MTSFADAGHGCRGGAAPTTAIASKELIQLKMGQGTDSGQAYVLRLLRRRSRLWFSFIFKDVPEGLAKWVGKLQPVMALRITLGW